MLRRFRLYIFLAIGLCLAVQNIVAQTSCDITFYYQHDTIEFFYRYEKNIHLKSIYLQDQGLLS